MPLASPPETKGGELGGELGGGGDGLGDDNASLQVYGKLLSQISHAGDDGGLSGGDGGGGDGDGLGDDDASRRVYGTLPPEIPHPGDGGGLGGGPGGDGGGGDGLGGDDASRQVYGTSAQQDTTIPEFTTLAATQPVVNAATQPATKPGDDGGLSGGGLLTSGLSPATFAMPLPGPSVLQGGRLGGGLNGLGDGGGIALPMAY